MEFDRRMMGKVDSDGREQFFRIYTWDPPAVSLGKNQEPDRVLDTEYLSKAGVTVVKRPTGGRAIYHKNDVCISSAGSLHDAAAGGVTAGEIYDNFADTLKLFFENLNTETILARGPRLQAGHRSGIGKLPCFLSATPYELLASGRKIAGIALYVGRDRFLVQSSVRISAYLPDDFHFFRGLNNDGSALAYITSLEEQTGLSFSEDELRNALLKALESGGRYCVINIDEGEI
jgi:lipoate-protein ligase A